MNTIRNVSSLPPAPRAVVPSRGAVDSVILGGSLQDVPPKLAEVRKLYFDPESEAQEIEAYYKGADLSYAGLSKLVQDTHVNKLAYKPRQFLYPWVDLQPSLRLKSVYSPEAVTLESAPRGNKRQASAELLQALREAPMDAVALAQKLALVESRGWLNCEHVVPQIWFDDEATPMGDLHHLFASTTLANLERTNRKLTDVANREVPAHSGEGWKDTHNGGSQFEPAAGKGEVARATLYFLLRYPGKIGDGEGEYSAEDVQRLIRWHKENPVTLHEKHRNQEIFKLQGNRNPLIDLPDCVDQVDFTQGLAKV